MKHRQFRMPGRILDFDWEEARIFVIYVPQVGAVPMRISCETETLPMKEILRPVSYTHLDVYKRQPRTTEKRRLELLSIKNLLTK